MNLLPLARRKLIERLWADFRSQLPEAEQLFQCLTKAGEPVSLDHFGIRDLPGSCTGIPFLRDAFSALGFVEAGAQFQVEKKARFIWMRESNFDDLTPWQSLPQIVLAETAVELCSPEFQRILAPRIESLAQACKVSLAEIREHAKRASLGEPGSVSALVDRMSEFLGSVQYGQPSREDFEIVLRENELAAWTLLFGRKVNHVALAVYLGDRFRSLAEFNAFAAKEAGLRLNESGGLVKGRKEMRIEQSASVSSSRSSQLSGGEVSVPASFMEFVWRFPKNESNVSADELTWKQIFPDFFPEIAKYILESLNAKS